jgi:hypothetical protein
MSVQTPESESLPQARINVEELGAIVVDMDDPKHVERLMTNLNEKDHEFMIWLSRIAEGEEGSTETPQQVAIRYGLMYGDYFYRQQETPGFEALLPSDMVADEASPTDTATT